MTPLDSQPDDAFGQLVRRAITELPDAPPAWQRAAIGLWAPAPSPVAVLQSLARAAARQIVAALTFDSWAAPAVAQGMRSLRSPTRHLLFNAQGRDIDLRISPAEQAFALVGQVLGPDDAGSVMLEKLGLAVAGNPVLPAAGTATAGIRTAPLDSLGEFRLDGLEGGLYRMTLLLGDDEIVLQTVEVGEPTT
jgi:hypothetical protein